MKNRIVQEQNRTNLMLPSWFSESEGNNFVPLSSFFVFLFLFSVQVATAFKGYCFSVYPPAVKAHNVLDLVYEKECYSVAARSSALSDFSLCNRCLHTHTHMGSKSLLLFTAALQLEHLQILPGLFWPSENLNLDIHMF